jgi:hypothetical protein
MQDMALGRKENTVRVAECSKTKQRKKIESFGLNFEFCNWGNALWRISGLGLAGEGRVFVS